MLQNYNTRPYSRILVEQLNAKAEKQLRLTENDMSDADPMHVDVAHALHMLASGECTEEECEKYLAMALKKHDPSMSRIDGMMAHMSSAMKSDDDKDDMDDTDEAVSPKTKKNLKRLAVAGAAGAGIAAGVHYGLASHIMEHPTTKGLVKSLKDMYHQGYAPGVRDQHHLGQELPDYQRHSAPTMRQTGLVHGYPEMPDYVDNKPSWR